MILLALALAAAPPEHHAHYDQKDITEYVIRVHEEEETLPEGSEAREDLHDKATTLETDNPHDTKRIHDDLRNVTDSVEDHDLDCDGCRDAPEPEHHDDEDSDPD